MGYRPFQRNIIDPGYAYYGLKTTTEDRPEFADPELETAGWSTAQSGHKGLWWLRAKVDLSAPSEMSEKMGISIMLKGSYDLYFDGALIGKNGLIDASGVESRAGLYRKTFMIPDSLAGDGSHQVALRIANHRASSTQLPYIQTGDYLLLARQPLSMALFLHIAAGTRSWRFPNRHTRISASFQTGDTLHKARANYIRGRSKNIIRYSFKSNYF